MVHHRLQIPDQEGVGLHRVAQAHPVRQLFPQRLHLGGGGIGVKEIKRGLELRQRLLHPWLIHTFLPACSSS